MRLAAIRAPPDRTNLGGRVMVILGLILLVLGLIFSMSILVTIGRS